MVTLTVFTPTYNRANLLARGYNSLRNQTCHDFKWLIIDDGSKDETRSLVLSWLCKDSLFLTERGFIGHSTDCPWFEIRYEFKENGGLHTGYNAAIELMDTEICVCIDSDDFMPEDGVEHCVKGWEQYGTTSIAGLVGYDYTIQGKRLGEKMDEGRVIHYVQLKQDKRYQADNKIVLRVDLLKQVAPQPTFPGEKNFNPIWMIFKVDQLFPFVLMDKTLCIVDYQDSGMAANIVNQYFNSPRSFVELRKLYVSLKYSSLMWRVKHYIHLVADAKIAKVNPFSLGVNNFAVLLFYPLGILLWMYLNKQRKMIVQ